MTIRLLVCLGLAAILTVPVHAQSLRPQPDQPSRSRFSSPLGFHLTDTVRVTHRLALGFSPNKLLPLGPRLDTPATACPMPVMRPDPNTGDTMPVQTVDSTVSPAANSSLTLPSCYNDRFTRQKQHTTPLEWPFTPPDSAGESTTPEGL